MFKVTISAVIDVKEKSGLKKETRYFIRAFYIIVVTMYFVALLTVSCCAGMFPDGSTLFFWFSEIMNCANRILFMGIVICFLVEKII